MATVKETCAQRLMTVQNNYLLGLASVVLLGNASARETLRTQEGDFGGFVVRFDTVETYFRLPGQRDDSLRSLALLHLCSLVKDSFELTKHRAKIADRFLLMQAEPWYQFARLIRNCVAHSFVFDFNRGDLQRLPVTWNGITLDASMHGKELPLATFGWREAWNLFGDIRAFAVRSGI